MFKISKGFHRSVTILLAALFLISTPVLAASSHPFEDVAPRHEEAISALYKSKVVKGISETEFGVQQTLKRGDAAVILAGALGLDTEKAPQAGFNDVNNRIRGHVNALVQKKIMSGFTSSEFKPDEYLTRGQMAKILANAYNLYSYGKKTPFTDLTKTFNKEIEALYGAGITEGITPTEYGTGKEITRGDFAILLHKTMKFSQSHEKVKEVSPIEPISVSVGTTVEELNLPGTVEVIYYDNSKGYLNVTWNTSGFNSELPGEYVIDGEIEGNKEITSVKIIIHDLSVEKLDDKFVSQGAKVEDLELPNQVYVIHHDGTKENREVTWQLGELNLEKPGQYVIHGEMEGILATARVIVTVQKVEIEEFEDIAVVEGANVELPHQVKLTYHDETTENKEVRWDLTGLDLERSGEYVLNGTISDTTLKATIKVIVQKEYPEGISLGVSTITLKEGGTKQLTASLEPSHVVKKDLTWFSSDETIATVNETGLVTGVKEGEATITAKTENGKTASVTVTVSNRPNLNINAYASVLINGAVKKVNLSFINLDPEMVTVEKVEVYGKDGRVSSYTKSQLESNGIATEIAYGSSWGMSIDYLLGFWKEKSYAKFYIKSKDKTYEFQDEL